MTVDQPCVLCEETLQEWNVYRDDETRQERIEIRPVTHACEALRALGLEYVRTPAQRLKAQKN